MAYDVGVFEQLEKQRGDLVMSFLDFSLASRNLQPETAATDVRFLASDRYIVGAEVKAIEAEWAAYYEHNQALNLADGLDGLTHYLIPPQMR